MTTAGHCCCAVTHGDLYFIKGRNWAEHCDSTTFSGHTLGKEADLGMSNAGVCCDTVTARVENCSTFSKLYIPKVSQEWWCMIVILALGKLRKEHLSTFQVVLDMARSCLTANKPGVVRTLGILAELWPEAAVLPSWGQLAGAKWQALPQNKQTNKNKIKLKQLTCIPQAFS